MPSFITMRIFFFKISFIIFLLYSHKISIAQNSYLSITTPSEKRIIISSVNENTFEISINTNQPWKTRTTNDQLEILPYGSGSHTLELTIRAPHLENIDRIDTIFFLATHSNDADTLIIEQKGLGLLNNVSLSHLMTNIKYDGRVNLKTPYGGIGIDDYYCVVPSEGGGYIIGGWSNSIDILPDINGNVDWLFTKIDANGEEQWTKVLGSINYDINYFTIPSSDGNFVTCGFAKGSSNILPIHNGEEDIWVIKFNDDGNPIWAKNIGGLYIDVPREIVETKDGNYLLIGSSSSSTASIPNSNPSINYVILAVLLSKDNGDILWTYTLEGNNGIFGMATSTLPNGDIIIGGNTLSDHLPYINTYYGKKDIWLGSLYNNGTLKRSKLIGGSENDSLYSITTTPDNDIVIVGQSLSRDGSMPTPSIEQREYSIYIEQMDTNFNTIRSKWVGGNLDEMLPDIKFFPNGDMMLMVNSMSDNGDFTENNGDQDIWLKKYDNQWNEKWSYRYGGNGFDIGHNILLTQKGGAIIAAHVESDGLMALESRSNPRDALLLSVTESYLSTYPRKITIQKGVKDNISIIVLAENSQYSTAQGTNGLMYSYSQKQLENPNLSQLTFTTNPDINNSDILYDTFLVQLNETNLIDTIILEIFPARFINMLPEILYLEKNLASEGIINLTSSETWDAFLITNKYFSISTSSGQRDANIIVQAKQTNITKNYFEDTLYAYSTDKSIYDFSIIRQKFPDYFNIYPTTLFFEPSANITQTISIETNLNWSISPQHLEYFSISKNSINANTYLLNVNTTQNNFLSKRWANLVISCAICNDTTVTLTQDAFKISTNTLLDKNLRIRSNYKLPQNTHAVLYNYTGQSILDINLTDKLDERINISALPPDYYFLGIFTSDNTKIISKKVLKK